MILPTETVQSIRNKFIELLQTEKFTENKNKTGSKTVEIINASFIADEPVIFGEVNKDWVERESKWYHSKSLNINDIPGGAPAVWKMVATPDGFINSNYGWCIFTDENKNQFHNCALQLEQDKYSRRAEMIYTRPSMQYEYKRDGMSDFMCTEAVQYFIRDDQLISCVKMRSNDAIFGYKGDYAWQKEVQTLLFDRLKIVYPELDIGPIIWNAGSIHVYERHFHLITGKTIND